MRALDHARISAQELLDEQLDLIKQYNSRINALVHVSNEDLLRDAATASDERRRHGKALSKLDGLTLAVKDNIDVAGMPTTAGLGFSRRPSHDAAVVARAKAAGMLIVGKLNMDEAALGATTNNPHLGACHNPLRPGYTPGGSSGGSGAWVASGMGACALGTDTMGSVRIPAAYCGVVGLKPTRGWLSNLGVVPVCRALDTVGPLARRPEDLMSLLSLFSGREPAPSTDRESLNKKGFTLGWVEDLVLQPEVREHLLDVRRRLQDAGFRLQSTVLEGMDFGAVRRAGLLLSELEMLVTHREYLKTRPEAFSPSLTGMLDWARKQPPEVIETAKTMLVGQTVRIDALLARHDWFVLPAVAQTSFPFTDPVPTNQADYTAIFSISGHPALALPAGLAKGLPVGLQLVGRHDSDFELVRVAQCLFESFLNAGVVND